MKKIRINVLARELEMKSHLILDLLPELGVSEKLTHSSSIDEDVADKLRVHYGLAPLGNGDGHVSEAGEGEGRSESMESAETPQVAREAEHREPPQAAAPAEAS